METKITISLLALVSLILTLSAAVPLRWTVETSRVQPATFDVVRGETIALEATMQIGGKPFAMDSEPVCIFWQTNGMGSAWWTAPAAATSNRVTATFAPEMDPGAATVNGFLGSSGSIYRAAFTLRFRHGPGATPNVIEQPPRVLDLAHTVVINPPWPTDATIDASIRRVIDEDGITAPVSTNTVKGIISNTVDKAYVESLGISGGGSGGTNTNDVKAIVDAEVGGTNAVKSAVSDVVAIKATVETKRDMTNMFVIVHHEGWWPLTSKDIPENPTDGFTYYSEPSYDEIPIGNGWFCFCNVYSNGSWNRTGPFIMGGSSDRNAKEITYPDGTKAYRDADFYEDTLATSNSVVMAISGKADKIEVEEAKGMAADAQSAANDANVWSMATYNFMTGGRTNCWFSGTNYVFGADAATRTRFAWEDGMDAATVPCSMALWEIRDGARQLVWDQKDWPTWYWSFKAAQMNADIQGRIDALGNAVTNDANYAWAKRYASDGTPNPDASTTFIDTPSVTLSPGMKWETVATVSGAAYWTIVGNGAVIGGSGTNAVIRIQDFERNDILTITKGEHRLAWLENGDITGNMYDGNGWVCFDMLADAEPVGFFSTTLDASDFLPQTDPNCPAQYRWENIGGGKWRIHFLLKPDILANACFAKFQVEVEGQTVIRYNAGQEISGGLIYNGVKIAPDVSGSPAVGTVIQWKVVR